MTKKQPFLLQTTASHRSVRYNTDLQVLSKVFVLLGGGGMTSTRSWEGHLSQNTIHCLKCFCNWLIVVPEHS